MTEWWRSVCISRLLNRVLSKNVFEKLYLTLGLSDFQYLPMTRLPDGTYSSIRQQVFITKLHTSSWMNEPSPLFLPPPLFSRFDRSADYSYREPPQPRPGHEDNVPKLAPNIIGVCTFVCHSIGCYTHLWLAYCHNCSTPVELLTSIFCQLHVKIC